MWKYMKCLIFDNHDGDWDMPRDPDNYFFGIVQNIEDDKINWEWKDGRRRMLVIDINQDIVNNFRSQSDMALFVLETLNNGKWTIYME